MKQFDLDAFITFCRAKGKEAYNASDIYTCALAQFGFPGVATFDNESYGISDAVYNRVVASETQTTFDQLVARLESLQ